MEKKKIVKILASGGLALFMGIGTLCGILISPMNSTLASVSSSEETLNQNTNISPLGLDPENDPVLFTTESGLEVKFANATMASGPLSGYGYFTMGDYNGTRINWVIIGYGSTTSLNTPYISQDSLDWYNDPEKALIDYLCDTSNPAGVAINNEASKQQIMYNIIATATKAVKNTTELGTNEFLCFAEKNIYTNVSWGPFNVTANYETNSTLKGLMDNLRTELNLSSTALSLIQPQTLTNIFSSSSTSTTENAYFFPLGCRGDSFDIKTYISSASARRENDDNYWLRSGCSYDSESAHYISKGDGSGFDDGTTSYISDCFTGYDINGVRPAFVLQI